MFMFLICAISNLESVADYQVLQVICVAFDTLFNFINVVAIFWYPELAGRCRVIKMSRFPSVAKHRKCNCRCFNATCLFWGIDCNGLLPLELFNGREAKKEKKGNKESDLKGGFNVLGDLLASHPLKVTCSLIQVTDNHRRACLYCVLSSKTTCLSAGKYEL